MNARALTHTHSRSNKVWLCLCGCFCPTVTCLVATLIHCHTLTHTLIWYIYMPKYLYLMYMIPYRTKQTRARKTKGKIVRWLALFPMQEIQNDRLFFLFLYDLPFSTINRMVDVCMCVWWIWIQISMSMTVCMLIMFFAIEKPLFCERYFCLTL